MVSLELVKKESPPVSISCPWGSENPKDEFHDIKKLPGRPTGPDGPSRSRTTWSISDSSAFSMCSFILYSLPGLRLCTAFPSGVWRTMLAHASEAFASCKRGEITLVTIKRMIGRQQTRDLESVGTPQSRKTGIP